MSESLSSNLVAPLAIDLFCGLGGWTEGLMAEGYKVVGFDIEQHIYGEHRYPSQLVLQDVLTIHGRQFKGAALIVASPPCQAYSWRAMPWKAAKAAPPPDNALFEACFRIQAEATEAAGACTCGEIPDPKCPCKEADCACKRHWDAVGNQMAAEPAAFFFTNHPEVDL